MSATGARETILLVDDDTSFLKVAARIFEAKGYVCKVAEAANEALELVQMRAFNLAILDINLPDMAGTELLQRLIVIVPDIMVIMLTGHSSAQGAIKSLNNGAFAYLEKPVDFEYLLATVARAAEKRSLLLENRRLLIELEERNRETGILLDISRRLSQSLDIRQTAKGALEKLVESLDVDACHVHLKVKGQMVLFGVHGMPLELVEQLKPELRIGPSGFEKIVVSDLGETTSWPLCLAEKYRSYLAIPLTSGSEAIGIIGIATRSNHHFDSRELELLEGISREMAIAICNAQLYEEASSARSLRELDAMRRELLATVSHEFRTPLAAIKGYASALLQPDVDFDRETRDEFLRTIDGETDRLNRVVEDLLIMSRLDSGMLELKKRERYPAEIVESIKDNLLSLTLKHKLRLDIAADLPSVAVDDRIGAVFTNLVENAVKHSPEGSCITIKAYRNRREVVASVEDEGIGITKEFHEKIFERFYQIPDATSGHKRGTGLGLCICRGIVDAHGGRIWVESEPGKGAKFFFTLPAGVKCYEQTAHTRSR